MQALVQSTNFSIQPSARDANSAQHAQRHVCTLKHHARRARL